MDTTIGKNMTTIPTSEIQKNLGGLVVDDKYGPKTTAAVQAFQTANGLKADGIFGPLTQAAYQKKYNTSSGIISTGTVHDEAKDNSSALDAALRMFNINYSNPDEEKITGKKGKTVTEKDPNKDPLIDDEVTGTSKDPYIKGLDEMAARSNDSTKMLIANIKAIKERQKAKTETQYNNYKAGLQLLGIQTNQASVTPDLLASHLNEAESEKMDKINALDSEEVTALMEAENARADNDFKILNEKMSYVKEIRKAKAEALKEYQKTLTTDIVEQGKIAETVGHDIYDTLLTLDEDNKEEFLVAVAKKFNLPLGSLVTALTDEQATREKDSKKEDKVLSPSEAAVLGVPYGTTESQAAKLNITPARYKPKSGGGSGSGESMKTVIANANKRWKVGAKDESGHFIRGTDGYLDPQEYLDLYNQWTFGDKSFLSNFPVDKYINPASFKLLPENIRPKDKKTKAPLFS